MINIAELLKDKPCGIKLWSDTFGEVVLDTIKEDDEFPISLIARGNYDIELTSEGCYFRNMEGIVPCITPSKEMRDWEKFAWKKGDVLTTIDGVVAMFDGWAEEDYTRFNTVYSIEYKDDIVINFYQDNIYTTEDFHKDGEVGKKDFYRKIEEHYGGKFNLETLEIEQPKQEFKDGDIVFVEGIPGTKNFIEIFSHFNNGKIYDHAIYDIEDRTLDCSGKYPIGRRGYQDIRLATDSEKQQLFIALKKEGKVWNSSTKQIEDLLKKCEFKPFDKCVWKIYGVEGYIWQAGFVSYVDKYGAIPMGMHADDDLYNLIVLPYNEDTKHLIGTTDEWKENGKE